MSVSHVDFKQKNFVFKCPDDFVDCEPLNVYRYQASKDSYIVNVSTWELDAKAIEDIVKTKRIYLYVFSNGGHPPVSMGTESPFVF